MRTWAAVAAAAVAVTVTACGSTSPAPDTKPALAYSCGITVVSAQTGISVVLWQPYNSGKTIYVHQVTADWYGSDVTVKVNRRISWLPDNGNVEVDKPLPPSMYQNNTAKGCKVLSWR